MRGYRGRLQSFWNNRWLVFVVAMWVQSVGGIGYLYGSLSPIIKSSMGYNQKQIASLGVAKDLGDSVGFLAGSLSEVLPLWGLLLVGAIQNFIGYGWVWLVVTGRTASLPLLAEEEEEQQLTEMPPPNNTILLPTSISFISTNTRSPTNLQVSKAGSLLLSTLAPLALALTTTLTSPSSSLAIPSLGSQASLVSPSTPFTQSRDLQIGLDNGKIRPCPSNNPGCVSTSPKSPSVASPWMIPQGSSDDAVQKLRNAILKTQKNVKFQVLKETPDGKCSRL